VRTAICAGQPVINGTRMLVRVLPGYLAHGETTDAILREFPTLTEADVRAVIAFAAASARFDGRELNHIRGSRSGA
jgi:uncharacterized protein (DUF433 family)